MSTTDALELAANWKRHAEQSNNKSRRLVLESCAMDLERLVYSSTLITCEWTENESGYYWWAQCGMTWTFEVGGPTENQVRFCPGCGRSIKVKGEG